MKYRESSFHKYLAAIDRNAWPIILRVPSLDPIEETNSFKYFVAPPGKPGCAGLSEVFGLLVVLYAVISVLCAIDTYPSVMKGLIVATVVAVFGKLPST